jgi:parallel beta-helix repeat protein
MDRLAPMFALAVALAASLASARIVEAVAPDSELIGCERADDRLTISVSSHLDPSCTWTRGVDIVASDVVFDCQGAHIATTDRRYGILITAPTDVALSNITVRNCHIEGFLNNIHIEREGFRDLAAGVEYEHAFSNIVIEDSTSLDSRGVGIFVDGYVTGVMLRRLRVEGSGSAGIYLEAGSKDNVVEQNEIVNNGYEENGPDGQFFELAGASFWFWGPGREGLAIDGSRNNRVVDNHFSGNSAGGIFLYKNCGEFVNQRPARWFERRYGADGNLIEGNTFAGEDTGVWIASRMGENTLPMDCSDPAYIDDPPQRVVLDYADDTVVRSNVFENVTYGVRTEDDHAVIADNTFTGDDPALQAVIVGTRFRTPALGLPVDGTVITGNRAFIAGNPNPYRWIHGHANTTFTGNESRGRLVGFCEGAEPPRTLFIFVIAFVPAEPPDPPNVPPPVVPPPVALPPCPIACARPAAVAKPWLVVARLDTPPGDDTLTVRGDVVLAHPFAPPLDPVAVGVGILVTEATGGHILDVLVPGGAFDRATQVGWKAAPTRGTWKYANRSADPPGAVTAVTVKDLSKNTPGLVRVGVKARRGAFAVDPTRLPLTALVVLDPPTAETGQCGKAAFPGPMPTCTADARAVRCR